jgi:hypothetical protein
MQQPRAHLRSTTRPRLDAPDPHDNGDSVQSRGPGAGLASVFAVIVAVNVTCLFALAALGAETLKSARLVVVAGLLFASTALAWFHALRLMRLLNKQPLLNSQPKLACRQAEDRHVVEIQSPDLRMFPR